MTLLDSTTGSKSSGSDFFSSDISPPKGWNILIHLAVASSCVLEYTVDGSNFVQANDGTPLTASRGYILEIPADEAIAFNLRQTSGSAVTVTFCRVYTGS